MYKYIVGLLLIATDQLIKLVILFKYVGCNKVLISGIIYFKPVKNEQLSWLNAILNLGLGFIPQVVINALCIILFYYLFKFYTLKRKETTFGIVAYVVFIAGALCSMLDKIFWGGSLDYILYTGVMGGYTFDLKDCFIVLFEFMLMFAFILNLNRDKEYLKFLNSLRLYDLVFFIQQEVANKLTK